MPNQNVEFTQSGILTVTSAGFFGVNNTNPQYALDVSGSLNLNTGGGIVNLGSYVNPPLILGSGQSGAVGGYSYVVGTGAIATGYFPTPASNAGQEIFISSKSGGVAVTGITSGIVFYNTGTLTSGFTIPSGLTRFFFSDAVHWVVQ